MLVLKGHHEHDPRAAIHVGEGLPDLPLARRLGRKRTVVRVSARTRLGVVPAPGLTHSHPRNARFPAIDRLAASVANAHVPLRAIVMEPRTDSRRLGTVLTLRLTLAV